MGDVDDSSRRHTFPPPQIEYGSHEDEHTRNVVFDQDDVEAGQGHSEQVSYRGAASVVDRIRLILARFGRLSGMRLPGISYSSMRSERSSASSSQRMGGGISQDGVFSNMNAKPDAMRTAVDPHDRGDDDDLVSMRLIYNANTQADDTLPPTYEAAAADSAPTYWESNVFGASALADSEGVWSENSATVGEVPDMIQDGMMVGTIFAFCWNLFVSASFQFIGFVLTFLLHSTHAAKFGSRTGLGISLMQYGFDMRLAVKSNLAAYAKDHKDDENNAENMPSEEAIWRSKMGCNFLIILGIFLMVEAVIKFALLYRKSSRIVAEARRQEQQTLAIPNPASASEEPPVPFLARFTHWIRTGPINMITNSLQSLHRTVSSDMSIFMGELPAHSAEDYVIRPGYGFAADPVLFTWRNGQTSEQLDDEALAHTVGLTDPFTGRAHAYNEEEVSHGLRAVRFM